MQAHARRHTRTQLVAQPAQRILGAPAVAYPRDAALQCAVVVEHGTDVGVALLERDWHEERRLCGRGLDLRNTRARAVDDARLFLHPVQI
eukprot:363690-Chlamydomonas_euryale.AAC.2